jgi:hypothetical protein
MKFPWIYYSYCWWAGKTIFPYDCTISLPLMWWLLRMWLRKFNLFLVTFLHKQHSMYSDTLWTLALWLTALNKTTATSVPTINRVGSLSLRGDFILVNFWQPPLARALNTSPTPLCPGKIENPFLHSLAISFEMPYSQCSLREIRTQVFTKFYT